LIDCDVHCGIPSFEVIGPYLPDHWEEYLRVLMNYRQPAAIDVTYPSWPDMFARSASDVGVDDVRDDVLTSADAAILHCYYGVESLQHPYLAPTFATAVNRWLQKEWLDCDGRLLAAAVITPHLVPAAVEEIDRIAEHSRFVEVLVPANAAAPYGSERFWPIWEAAASNDLVVAITYGGVSVTPPTPLNWVSSFFEEYSLGTLAFQSQLVSLIYSGVFDRFPNLRFTMNESGWTWLPAFLWKMDAEWKAMRIEIPWVREPPSTYARRHFRFTTQPVDVPPTGQELEQLLEQLGSDELLIYGSDFPHRYPTGEDLLAGLPADRVEQVRWRSAWNWYGLERRLAPTAPLIESRRSAP
jgi:predicted TIM-barrel fold metal-dependent hydrolase